MELRSNIFISSSATRHTRIFSKQKDLFEEWAELHGMNATEVREKLNEISETIAAALKTIDGPDHNEEGKVKAAQQSLMGSLERLSDLEKEGAGAVDWMQAKWHEDTAGGHGGKHNLGASHTDSNFRASLGIAFHRGYTGDVEEVKDWDLAYDMKDVDRTLGFEAPFESEESKILPSHEASTELGRRISEADFDDEDEQKFVLDAEYRNNRENHNALVRELAVQEKPIDKDNVRRSKRFSKDDNDEILDGAEEGEGGKTEEQRDEEQKEQDRKDFLKDKEAARAAAEADRQARLDVIRKSKPERTLQEGISEQEKQDRVRRNQERADYAEEQKDQKLKDRRQAIIDKHYSEDLEAGEKDKRTGLDAKEYNELTPEERFDAAQTKSVKRQGKKRQKNLDAALAARQEAGGVKSKVTGDEDLIEAVQKRREAEAVVAQGGVGANIEEAIEKAKIDRNKAIIDGNEADAKKAEDLINRLKTAKTEDVPLLFKGDTAEKKAYDSLADAIQETQTTGEAARTSLTGRERGVIGAADGPLADRANAEERASMEYKAIVDRAKDKFPEDVFGDRAAELQKQYVDEEVQREISRIRETGEKGDIDREERTGVTYEGDIYSKGGVIDPYDTSYASVKGRVDENEMEAVRERHGDEVYLKWIQGELIPERTAAEREMPIAEDLQVERDRIFSLDDVDPSEPAAPEEPKDPQIGTPDPVKPVPAEPEGSLIDTPDSVTPVPAEPEVSLIDIPDPVKPVPAPIGDPINIDTGPVKPVPAPIGDPINIDTGPVKPVPAPIGDPINIDTPPVKPVLDEPGAEGPSGLSGASQRNPYVKPGIYNEFPELQPYSEEWLKLHGRPSERSEAPAPTAPATLTTPEVRTAPTAPATLTAPEVRTAPTAPTAPEAPTAPATLTAPTAPAPGNYVPRTASGHEVVGDEFIEHQLDEIEFLNEQRRRNGNVLPQIPYPEWGKNSPRFAQKTGSPNLTTPAPGGPIPGDKRTRELHASPIGGTSGEIGGGVAMSEPVLETDVVPQLGTFDNPVPKPYSPADNADLFRRTDNWMDKAGGPPAPGVVDAPTGGYSSDHSDLFDRVDNWMGKADYLTSGALGDPDYPAWEDIGGDPVDEEDRKRWKSRKIPSLSYPLGTATVASNSPY